MIFTLREVTHSTVSSEQMSHAESQIEIVQIWQSSFPIVNGIMAGF
jgi:hypothetical protein